MCRDFDPAPLGEGTLESLVDAATRAPSAGNTHGLGFVALEGEHTATYWDVTLPHGRRADFAWPGLLSAPLLLLVYVEPGAWARRYGEADKASTGLGELGAWPVPYWFVDAGASVMAILLAAEDLGLGALFFGQFEHEEPLREAFGVPPGNRAVGTVAVGHRAVGGRNRSMSARRGRPGTGEILHRGSW